MADRTLTDRLQPALLDRLTDREPERLTESRDARIIDVHRLREIIRRDLVWLLNTHNLDSEIDAARFPQTVQSTLNYGVEEVSGEFSTERRAERIRVSIRRAIELFEPRMDPASLKVTVGRKPDLENALVAFDIVGEMWAQPVPLQLYLRSEVDITTGELTLEEAR